VSDGKSIDKRFRWLAAAVAFNTVTSLAAIGLWFLRPTGVQESSSPSPPVPSGAVAQAPMPAARPPLESQHPGFPGPLGRTPSAPHRTLAGQEAVLPPPARLDAHGLSKNSDVKIAPSTQALAERLRLGPEILAQTFGDEAGEIPRGYASRLERAFDKANALARRLQLDESKTQSLVALVTHYAFSILREEKLAAPGSAEMERIEQITNEIVADIKTTCGEDVSAAAAVELGSI
jgi:hypothetical protein